MARRAAAETRELLIERGKALMMRKGYNATTVDEIVEATGVTKGAFFYHFGSKDRFGVELLESYWHERRHEFRRGMGEIPSDPADRVFAFLDSVANVFATDDRGVTCLAGLFSLELAAVDSSFRRDLSLLFDEWAKQINDDVANANRGRFSPDQLVDHVIATIQGAIVLARARDDAEVIRRQIQVLESALRLLFDAAAS